MANLSRNGLRRAFLPEGAIRFLGQLGLRLSGLVLIMSGLLLAIALASYCPEDSSWNTAANKPIVNACGSCGAIISDLFLQTLGFSAVLPVLCLIVWGARFMGAQTIPSLLWRLLIIPVAALLLATGLAILPQPFFWPFLTIQPGGFAGRLFLNKTGDFLCMVGLSYDWRWIMVVLATSSGLILFLFILGIELTEWRKIVKIIDISLSLLKRAFEGCEQWRRNNLSTNHIHIKGAVAETTANPCEGEGATKVGTLVPSIDLLKISGLVRNASGDVQAASSGIPNALHSPVLDSSCWNQLGKTAKRNVSSDSFYQLPPVRLLTLPESTMQDTHLSEESLTQNARVLETVLNDFSVHGRIVKIRPGPVVALYELEPAPGTKTARIISLSDDIARSMSTFAVRVAVVPGQNVIGIELPNIKRETVYLRELLAADGFCSSTGKLLLALGKDIGGAPIYVDLARMPHLLIAGTTGSGKSVALNTMILSLLYRLQPADCRLIMIDPKMLELSVYNGIPHLLAPVVTDPFKAVLALKWAVQEMESRYRAMSQLGVRNITGYNQRVRDACQAGQILKRTVQTGFSANTGKPVYENQTLALDPLPSIVVVVDEIADLMLMAGKEIEGAIQRLAQMARAAGLHLIMATQRPSVDVITGTIKANFPTRISFQVTSKIDSRTILGEQGAEQLLGYGDMLYMAAAGRITRVHGPFVSDDEVEQIVKYLKTQGEPTYIPAITKEEDNPPVANIMELVNADRDSKDGLYDQAVTIVLRERKCSTSFIQRRLQVGYNRAARIVKRMEVEEVVSRPNHTGKREVLRSID